MDQFVDVLRAAQGGQALENVARFYGLSAQQALKVAETMTPAFAEAFRQVTQSPDAMASLMALMTSGPYGALYNQPAAPGELNAVGTDALNAVFGSSEVSRAVATQVAASTGLGVAVVKQMMPTLATLMVGGLAKSLAASGALQQMLAAMLSRMPGQTEARGAPVTTGNPWVDAFAAFATTTAANQQRAFGYGTGGAAMPSAAFTTGNPWADAFAQMMFQRPAPAPQRPVGNSWQDVVNAMTQTMQQAMGMPEPAKLVPAAAPPPPAPKPLPTPAAAPAAASGVPVNPLAPFQEFFAKMFAQGFPPAFPGTNAEGTACTLPELWLRMMTPPGTQRQGGSN